jgi:hypothetical protein
MNDEATHPKEARSEKIQEGWTFSFTLNVAPPRAQTEAAHRISHWSKTWNIQEKYLIAVLALGLFLAGLFVHWAIAPKSEYESSSIGSMLSAPSSKEDIKPKEELVTVPSLPSDEEKVITPLNALDPTALVIGPSTTGNREFAPKP